MKMFIIEKYFQSSGFEKKIVSAEHPSQGYHIVLLGLGFVECFLQWSLSDLPIWARI